MDSSASQPAPASQINWLEMARLAAQGQGHQDLGRGIHRLATLAAAVHRHTSASVIGAQAAGLLTAGGIEKEQRAHGWAPQTDAGEMEFTSAIPTPQDTLRGATEGLR